MNIKDAIDFFLILKAEAMAKSEIKVYDKFIAILSDLKQKDITKDQILAIETELKGLNLNAESENQKRYLSKKLSEFEKFLKEDLDLITDGYYTSHGMIYGMLAGVLAQMYFDFSSLLYGLVIGLVIGAILDSEAKKKGKVLKTKLDKT